MRLKPFLALLLPALAAGAGLQGAARAALAAKGGALRTLGRADSSLAIRVARLDGPELKQAASMALSRGAKVRLLLDRTLKANHDSQLRLKKQGFSIRWSKGAGAGFAVADGRRVALGDFASGKAVVVEDAALAADFLAQFEAEWGLMPDQVPEEDALKAEFDALPDPREDQPRLRLKRRRQ
jgi:hypothetical protein